MCDEILKEQRILNKARSVTSCYNRSVVCAVICHGIGRSNPRGSGSSPTHVMRSKKKRLVLRKPALGVSRNNCDLNILFKIEKSLFFNLNFTTPTPKMAGLFKSKGPKIKVLSKDNCACHWLKMQIKNPKNFKVFTFSRSEHFLSSSNLEHMSLIFKQKLKKRFSLLQKVKNN